MKTINEVGMLAIMEDKKLVGVVFQDIEKRSAVFYKVNEMGFEEISELFNSQNYANGNIQETTNVSRT